MEEFGGKHHQTPAAGPQQPRHWGEEENWSGETSRQLSHSLKGKRNRFLSSILFQLNYQNNFHVIFLKCRSVTNFTEGTTSTSTSLLFLSSSSISSSQTSSSTMSFSHIPSTSLRMEIFIRIKSFQRWVNAPFTSKYFIHKKIQYNIFENYFRYGPSGSVVTLDILCLLPLNILNEKIYLGLSFW